MKRVKSTTWLYQDELIALHLHSPLASIESWVKGVSPFDSPTRVKWRATFDRAQFEILTCGPPSAASAGCQDSNQLRDGVPVHALWEIIRFEARRQLCEGFPFPLAKR